MLLPLDGRWREQVQGSATTSLSATADALWKLTNLQLPETHRYTFYSYLVKHSLSYENYSITSVTLMSTGSCFMKTAIAYNYVIEQVYVIIRRSLILLVEDEYFFKLKLKNSDSSSIGKFRHKKWKQM